MKKIAALLIALALAVALAGCGNNNFRDLENVASQDPDKVVLLNNTDQHPNLVILCYKGVAWVTTTRDYGDALTRAEEYDKSVCATDG